MHTENMRRVNKGNSCPICGKADWCLVANDGSAAICQRVKEGSLKKCGDAGYLHILTDRHNGHDRHKYGVKTRHTATIVQGQDGPTQNFAQLSAHYQSQLADEGIDALTRSLGVSGMSLQRLRVGWDGSAYTFPMSDHCGRIIGIRRRFPNGQKTSAKGSKTGLFIPIGLSGGDPLLLCEGATDTTAALDLGFDAIGRPNCNSVVAMTVKAARGRAEIVVVADNDPVGKMGAEKLAGTLALHYPCVKIIVPPNGVKDLRQWFSAGLTTAAIRENISAALPISLKIRFCHVNRAEEARQ